LPTTTNTHHYSLRAQYAAEAQLWLLIANPVLPALILPSVGNYLDIDVDW
jgi:hypothetical protein